MVHEGEFKRVMIMNFFSAFLISYVICYALTVFGLGDLLYIGNLFGVYFLVMFGVKILVDEGEIPNNRERFILAVVSIIIFDIIFILAAPFVFGQSLFAASNCITFVLNGAKFDLVLNAAFYIFIFAVLVLIFNYLLYKSDKA